MSTTTRQQPATAGGGARARLGGNALISVIAAAAILLMVNYLAQRHYARADWTAAGIYTLSDKSTKVVAALDRDVELYALWSQQDPRFPDVKELLDNYLGHSARLKLEVVDPDLAPERVQMIIDRFGAKLQSDAQGQVGIEAGVFVVSGDKVKFVSAAEFEDFAGDPFGGGGEGEEGVSGFKAEQEITAAIMRVTADEQTTICFVQGHGEWQFDGFGGRALGHVKEGLKQDSYAVKALATAGASHVPADCALVVVAGPERALMEEEAALLDKYLERGGRLLLLLDPLIEGDRFGATGLERLTARYGIKLRNDLLLETDPRRLVSPMATVFLASEFTGHAAVKQLAIPDTVGDEVKSALGAYPVVFSAVRSLEQADSDAAVTEPLARSSESSWGEVDLAALGTGESVPEQDQYDTAGPAPIAFAAALPGAEGQPDAGGRLVVVGDCDFLSEELFVNGSLFNRDFWSGLVGWLTAREDLISIAPKNPEHVRLSLTEDDVTTVWQVVIGEALLVLVIGVIVWIRRRS